MLNCDAIDKTVVMRGMSARQAGRERERERADDETSRRAMSGREEKR